MKTFKALSLIAALIVLLSNCSETDDAVPQDTQEVLIAHYPLISDAVDVTGLNGSMTLVNTPFEDSGIYSNGIYIYSGNSDYSIAQTPHISTLNFQSFSISVDFKVLEKRTQPVFMVGESCRVIGFYLSEFGIVELLYNNWDKLTTQKTYSLNEWHNAKISFDGTTVKIFYDSELVGSLKFGNGYVPLAYESCGTTDAKILVTNYSNGESLRGYIRNLEVYSPQ